MVVLDGMSIQHAVSFIANTFSFWKLCTKWRRLKCVTKLTIFGMQSAGNDWHTVVFRLRKRFSRFKNLCSQPQLAVKLSEVDSSFALPCIIFNETLRFRPCKSTIHAKRTSSISSPSALCPPPSNHFLVDFLCFSKSTNFSFCWHHSRILHGLTLNSWVAAFWYFP